MLLDAVLFVLRRWALLRIHVPTIQIPSIVIFLSGQSISPYDCACWYIFLYWIFDCFHFRWTLLVRICKGSLKNASTRSAQTPVSKLQFSFLRNLVVSLLVQTLGMWNQRCLFTTTYVLFAIAMGLTIFHFSSSHIHRYVFYLIDNWYTDIVYFLFLHIF